MTIFKHLPKIDLHCHLDGSLSHEFLEKHLNKNIDINELIAPYDCSSLAEYLTKFDIPVSALQNYDNLKCAVIEVIRQAKSENITYLEIRFAPTLSKNNTLNYKDIYEAVIEGSQDGYKKYGVFSNIIICAMRHHSKEQNLDMLRSGREYLNHGICAMDLAGDEAGFPNENFIYLFEEAKRLEFPFTIHSGECGRVKNIKIAVDAGAKRIGHGICLAEDKALMEQCKEKHIGFELCPTSNYQTKAVKPGTDYPLRHFIDYGIKATVNTDNRTVSNTTMTREYNYIIDKLNIAKEELLLLYENSIELSFANDDIKNSLYKTIIDYEK
ncbi:MAG: adenosine deaminase [Lachnospiraceae bacterium]|nr:adenosine deaminase [Lachnospiraceae bacterium]